MLLRLGLCTSEPPKQERDGPQPAQAQAGREPGVSLKGEVSGRSSLDQGWKVGLILRRCGVSDRIWGCTLFSKAEVGERALPPPGEPSAQSRVEARG